MNKKNIGLFILTFLLIIGLSGCIPEKKKEEAEKPVSDKQTASQNQNYYTLQANKDSFKNGEEVDVNVYLTTTGEEFDLATAIVMWDKEKFDFVKAEKADLPGDEEALSTFVSGNPGKRILAQFVPHTDPPLQNMQTEAGKPVLFYTITLKALQDNPQARIYFSQEGANDLSMHLVKDGEQEVNSISQDTSYQSEISF